MTQFFSNFGSTLEQIAVAVFIFSNIKYNFFTKRKRKATLEEINEYMFTGIVLGMTEVFMLISMAGDNSKIKTTALLFFLVICEFTNIYGDLIKSKLNWPNEDEKGEKNPK